MRASPYSLNDLRAAGTKMNIDQLIAYIRKSRRHPTLYHFTDDANLPLISVHGLLSTDKRKAQGVCPEFRGGNNISHREDITRNITDYVCLSFTDEHPLYFVAKGKRRLPNPTHLKICPDILKVCGVIFADGVANAGNTCLMSLSAAGTVDKIDRDVLYNSIDWHDRQIMKRLKIASKAEILVPKCVPLNMIISGL